MNNSKRLSVKMTKNEYIWGYFFLLMYLLLLGRLLRLVFVALDWDVYSTAGQARLNFVYFALNFLCALGIFHRFLWKNLGTVGRRFWGFVQAVILGWVFYQAVSYLVTLGLYWLRPSLQNLNNEYIVKQASREFLRIAVGTVFLAPVTEECLFRGLIFQGLHKKSRVFAYIISTLAFALIHVLGYLGSYGWGDMLLILLQYLPAGVALAWSYEKADSIFAPILIHMLNNAISLGLLTR